MEYIDIGINLMHRQFQDDRESVIEQAVAAGVASMIITGTSVRGSQLAANYAQKHPGILYSTAGVHPHDAKSCNGQTIQQLRALCAQKQVVAVGECGLDYDRDFSPRETQKNWFEAQLQLAQELDMPLFLHERAAFEDFTALLRQYSKLCEQSVVHCFTGNKKELETYLELGCYIGITGWICDERRGEGLRHLVKLIPDDRLMIETDAPFLMPRNLSPKPDTRRNEPVHLPHIAAEIAKCKGTSVEALVRTTTENTKRFFRFTL